MTVVEGPGPVRVRSGPGAVVPAAEVRTYYDRPVIKPPVWTWEIPWYFFAGGLAGASSTMAVAAAAAGNEPVARAARRAAGAAAAVCPALLISDLGRPERFLHMLRVFKITSPMSVGSWVLAGYAPAAVTTAVLAETGALPGVRRLAQSVAGILGPALGTYTAALVADTAVPVWHEARRTLPFSFAGGAAASAGAVATALLDPSDAGAARRVAIAGTVLEGASTATMEHQLGDLGHPYHEGRAGRLARAAKTLSVCGTALIATAGRKRRTAAVTGAALLLAGQACHRWAVFRAGFQSAEEPRDTIAPQRRRHP